MNYLVVLEKYYKKCAWCVGDTYDSLMWNDKNIEKPTNEHLITLWEEMKHEYELNLFRVERDALLKESDIYIFSDYPHKSQEIKDKWVSYRQALRDSTKDKILPSKPT